MDISGRVEIDRSPSLTDQHKTERTEDTTRDQSRYTLEKVTLGVLSVYAVLTLLVYCATKKTADAAAKTAGTTEKTLVLDQRAWVGVQGTQDADFAIDKGFLVTIVFANSGKTPAHNVQTSAGYKTSPTPISGPTNEELAQLEFKPSQSIAPQSKYNMSLGKKSAGEGATPHQMEGIHNLLAQFPDIKKRNLVLYYYGIVRYDDIFNTTHQTQFCVYLADPETKKVGVCDAFNDLD